MVRYIKTFHLNIDMAGYIFHGKGVNKKTAKEISFRVPEKFSNAGVEALQRNVGIKELSAESVETSEEIKFSGDNETLQGAISFACYRGPFDKFDLAGPHYLTGFRQADESDKRSGLHRDNGVFNYHYTISTDSPSAEDLLREGPTDKK